MGALADWVRENLTLLLPLVAGAVALALLMPREPQRRSWRVAGGIVGLFALVGGGFWLAALSGDTARDFVFHLLAAVAIAAGALMVTSGNPIYAALWFALTTLSVCGLFLLRSAPFLAAATVIVYAGAIVVTFLFVIMLARQHGSAIYDRQASRPVTGIVITFVLLGAFLVSIRSWRDDVAAASMANEVVVASPVAVEANPLSRPAAGNFATMRGLGRSLFGDYLFAVELAGTLLLVAAIGAIAIAPRRSQETL